MEGASRKGLLVSVSGHPMARGCVLGHGCGRTWCKEICRSPFWGRQSRPFRLA